jgi:nitrite reductase/ring-hydroxylating ferredoxin subunit
MEESRMTWSSAVSVEKLRRDGAALAKVAGKQIALFFVDGQVFACNNRCPHEGYPLREGTVNGACVLTCNWHGWKFDLKTGANLFQGDRLRLYPTRLEDDMVMVDITDPPPEERQARSLEHMRTAFDDHEYDRIAREVARLVKAGGDPARAVVAAIRWSHDRLRFGMTHAYAAAEGWLRLHDRLKNDPKRAMISIVEPVAHMAWDCLREPAYPFETGSAKFDRADFAAAIEAQDEAKAVAMLRGALAAGTGFAGLERPLTAAALSHYADFGHSLIYVGHLGRLTARLGPEVEEPLLLALVRSLINSSREDLIPEFRQYRAMLDRWPQQPANGPAPAPDYFRGHSVNKTMELVAEAAASAAPASLHTALLGAAAAELLNFDTRVQRRTDNKVQENVGWLDFTHPITFANALRRLCHKYPEFWPAGLLQMACFLGRSAPFVERDAMQEGWHLPGLPSLASRAIDRVFDHGEPDYIHSVHLLKTYLAAEEEITVGLPPVMTSMLLAAVNRYIHEPPKRRHVRRVAHQALEFVALED